MPRIPATAALATVVLPFLPSVGLADVTPAEVWAAWQSAADAAGENVSLTAGAEENDGSGLLVRDMEVVIGDGRDAVTFDVGDVRFDDAGEGTVAVTFAEVIPILPGGDLDSEAELEFLALTFANLDTRVGGEPETLVYDISADRLAVEGRGTAEGEATATFAMAFNEMSATVERTAPEGLSYVSSLFSESVSLTANVDGAGAETFDLSVGLQNFQNQTRFVIPADVAFEEAFERNDTILGTSTNIASTALAFALIDDETDVQVTATMGPSMQSTEVVDGALFQTGSVKDVVADVSAAGLPVPVTVSIAGYESEIEFPTVPSSTAELFSFYFDLDELMISDGIWDLFDPTATLSRDALNMTVGLSGGVRLIHDGAVEMGAQPVEISSLSIDTFSITGLGAGVDAKGSFTFDNDDLETFDGFPATDGEATVTLTGAAALLNNMVSLGLLPQEQAMGAQLVFGLFFQPVAGSDDAISSTVTVTPDGAVSANGQRLR